MSTFLCLLLVKLRTADGHLVTMIHELLDAVLQRQGLRTLANDGNAVDTEATLQLRHLIELVEHHIRVRITLQVNYDTHTFTVRLIVHIADTLNLLFVDQVGNTLDEFRLIYIIRYLVHDDLLVLSVGLKFSLRTNHNTSTTRIISLTDAIHTTDNTTCWEVRTFDILHQTVCVDIRIIDISHTSVDYLTQIMCRNVSRHTYRNTRRTIDEKIRNLR